MKILFHTHLAHDFPDRISDLAGRFPDDVFAVASNSEELFGEIADADVLVDYKITEDLLDAAPRLQWVFVPFTGVNSLPMDLLVERKIRVSNNHGNAMLVAERSLGLALSAMGRISEYDRGMRRGHWFRNEGRDQPFEFWTSLGGKKVSILGMGAIGRAIALLLQPFRCEVTGFRRADSALLPEGFSQSTTNLHEALISCDVCFVTLPLTEKTRGLIGGEELAFLEGACLVNVSRGPIIQEAPLFEALRTGRLGTAGLDVWHRSPEPFHADRIPSEYPFHELENAVLSPHAGSHAPEGKGGQLDGTIENIVSLIEKGYPKDIVDTSDGY